MAIKFSQFTTGTTTDTHSSDYLVGYDSTLENIPNGERKWTLSTVSNAVSGIMSTQLANTFVKKSDFTGTNQSLVTPSGFQKLPGGLIINWGRVSLASGSGTTLNYAQSFTTEVLGVSVAALAAGTDNWAVVTAYPSSLTQIAIGREWTNGPFSTDWCFYIALGY